MKKLYKSVEDKKIAGVIGVGEFYNIDPALLRLARLVFLVLTGIFPGIVIYIIAAIIMPKRISKE